MKINTNSILKLVLLLTIFVVSIIFFNRNISDFTFCFEASIIVCFFSGILIFSKDYMNPFIFFFIYSFLGFLDVILVVVGIRKVDFVYNFDIYNKTLFLMILWFISFSIGFFISTKSKIKKKSKEKKQINLNINPNITLFFSIFVVLYVVYKIIKSTSSFGGIMSAFFNEDFKIFYDQNYLSMIMALCGIVPVLYLSKGKKKMAIITLILTFILMSLTKRRTLTLTYSLVPVATYYNYKVRKIRAKDLALVMVPLAAFVIFIGNIRGVSSGTSAESSNAMLNQLASLTRQVEYGKNVPDLVYGMDYSDVEQQGFKYMFNGIVTYIPRALWKNKPMVESSSIVTSLLYPNQENAAGHPVGPYGWSYLLFGYVGVIILGFLNGLIVQKFYRFILDKNNLFYYLVYSYSIVKMLEIFAPEAQFKISFFILCFLIFVFISKLLEKKKKTNAYGGIQ